MLQVFFIPLEIMTTEKKKNAREVKAGFADVILYSSQHNFSLRNFFISSVLIPPHDIITFCSQNKCHSKAQTSAAGLSVYEVNLIG